MSRSRLYPLQIVRSKISDLATIVREGPDALEPHPVLEFIAEGIAVCLLSASTVTSLMEAMLQRLKPASGKESRRAHASTEYWLLADSEFRYVDVSEHFCRMIGLKRSALIGRSAEDITPEELVEIAAARERIRREGWSRGLWVYRHRDGHLIPVTYFAQMREDSTALIRINPISPAA